MLNLGEIYRRDQLTRGDSGGPRTLKRVALGLTAVLSGTFFSEISLDLLAAVLAVQSILAGFGFNVLVYLSTDKSIPVPESAKIERKLKIRRVNKLGQDIFYNISYFNTLALLCIGVALSIAVTHAFSAYGLITIWHDHYYFTEEGKSAVHLTKVLAPRLLATLLYLLIIISLLTFVRIIRRATYFFEQKMALSTDNT